jgi:uncharacterized protein YfeS
MSSESIMRIIVFLVLFFHVNQTFSQMVSADKLKSLGLTPEEVSEQARTLLIQDFYWSPVDDFSPFGNDNGHDAFHAFKEWRQNHPSASPVTFLDQLISDWGFPPFDLKELGETEIAKYLEIKAIGISPSLISFMREEFKKMAKQAGKEFKEEEFQEVLAMSQDSMGGTYLLSQDNAVIAVGFGQSIILICWRIKDIYEQPDSADDE